MGSLKIRADRSLLVSSVILCGKIINLQIARQAQAVYEFCQGVSILTCSDSELVTQFTDFEIPLGWALICARTRRG